MSSKRKIIVLDRDGVINIDSDQYIKSVNEWLPEPGSLEAVVRLKKAGYRVAIATNQSGVGRGFYTEQTLFDIHQKMQAALIDIGGDHCRIDYIAYCPHTPNDQCQCRKPKTGLLDAIETMIGEKLNGAPFIGDSLKDLQAALAHACMPILVRTGKGMLTEKKLDDIDQHVPVYKNLAAAVDALLSNDTS